MGTLAFGKERQLEIVEFEEVRLAWLHTFVCIVKLGGYTKAAEFKGLKQPTISQQVSKLEALYGCKLLTNNRPPKMTSRGKKAYQLAEKILHDICNFNNLIERAVADFPNGNQNPAEFNEQERELLGALQIFWEHTYPVPPNDYEG